MMSDDLRGSSRISVLLDDVTPEQVEMLAEKFADVLVEHDCGAYDDGEDVMVRSLVVVRAFAWPEEIEGFLEPGGEMDGASMILMPGSGERDTLRKVEP